ncbi:YchJ family protein [Gordonia sp. DT101]|uniref:YchJ family protein n=1 Tax=Gordonia sp. DT101 TaxID=3416545 RepID=UPI003CF1D563
MSISGNGRSGNERCPCMSGLTLDECCGPILAGERKAGTAEALMRSRFTAFAVGDRDHLLASWHPRTRPRILDLDDTLQWYRLDIESTSGGTPFDTTGEVTFTAHHRQDGVRGSLHERSRFARLDGQWVYVDGVVS